MSWAVNARQAEALCRAHEGLMSVVQSVDQSLPIDFWTIDMRSAIIALGEVTGDEVGEEVLDSIFSKFCIGK
jgi:tRNA modification GTPase